jgi:predicted PurR-regulated permease PerM
MTNQQRVQLAFFLVLLALAAFMTYVVYRPFLNVIVLALVLAILLYPIYERILKLFGGRSKTAAGVLIVLAVVFILTPMTLLLIQIFNQSRDIYFELQSGRVDYIQQAISAIEKPIQVHYPNFSLDVKGTLQQIVVWIGDNAANIISSTSNILLGLMLVFISLYFFLKDGKKFLNYMVKLSPLDDSYDNKILHRIGTMVSSVVRGVLFIAVVQAILVGVGFYLFGVPNATLWGTVTVVASLLPFIGTAIIVFPAVAYLLFTGNLIGAVELAIWGTLLVGLIDNLLMPVMYGKGSQVHPLIILFAVLGGIYAFGPLGFLVGPIMVSFFIAVLEIYREYMIPQKTNLV